MSGGYFSYNQNRIGDIADEVEQLILTNDSTELDRYGIEKGRHYSEETIKQFKAGYVVLLLAQEFAQRIDWLVSGDDSEDSFHRRLSDSIIKITEDI